MSWFAVVVVIVATVLGIFIVAAIALVIALLRALRMPLHPIDQAVYDKHSARYDGHLPEYVQPEVQKPQIPEPEQEDEF